jgi:hypothetical protein
MKTLVITWTRGLTDNPKWTETFQRGKVVEVKRETNTFYLIAPMGFEQKVSKKSGLLTGFKDGYGASFVEAEANELLG